MKIDEFIQIGTFHTNHCEDYLIQADIGDNRKLLAVMDGCSMGTDSYLASTLIGKVLRKIAKEFDYKEFAEKTVLDLEVLLKLVLAQLFKEINAIKTNLQLERNELLSTLLLGIVDVENKAGKCITIGDGLICVDGVLTEYDHDNKPDYLAYHLEEDFETWYLEHQQKLSFKFNNYFAICTDGIFTFRRFDLKDYEDKKETQIIDFLLKDKSSMEEENVNLLKKKMIYIEHEWGLKPSDDLAIIKIVF